MSLNRSIVFCLSKMALVTYLFLSSSCTPFQGISSVTELPSLNGGLSISSINPNSSFILGGTTITVKGSGFNSDTAVSVGQYACTSLNIISATELTCVLPSVSSPITMDIVVSNSKGRTTLNSAFQFNLESFNSIEQFSGSESYGGSTNGTSQTAKLNRPSKPLVVGTDIYIADTDNHLIRKFDTLTGLTTTVAGSPSVSGTTDGVSSTARLSHPMGMTLIGSDIFFVDNGSCLVRKFNPSSLAVTTIAGIPNDCAAADNTTGLTSSFMNPVSLIANGSYLFIGDESLKLRRMSLTPPYPVESLAFDDDPYAIIDFAVIGQNLYYVDALNSTTSNVRYIDLSQTPPYTVNSLVSIPGGSGGLTTDGTDLYVSCPRLHLIKKYTFLSSTLSNLVGAGSAGNTDGTGTGASFHNPGFMDFSSGYIYVTSYGSHNLKKINLSDLSVITIMGNTK